LTVNASEWNEDRKCLSNQQSSHIFVNGIYFSISSPSIAALASAFHEGLEKTESEP
jgi:hypothetical protein